MSAMKNEMPSSDNFTSSDLFLTFAIKFGIGKKYIILRVKWLEPLARSRARSPGPRRHRKQNYPMRALHDQRH